MLALRCDSVPAKAVAALETAANALRARTRALPRRALRAHSRARIHILICATRHARRSVAGAYGSGRAGRTACCSTSLRFEPDAAVTIVRAQRPSLRSRVAVAGAGNAGAIVHWIELAVCTEVACLGVSTALVPRWAHARVGVRRGRGESDAVRANGGAVPARGLLAGLCEVGAVGTRLARGAGVLVVVEHIVARRAGAVVRVARRAAGQHALPSVRRARARGVVSGRALRALGGCRGAAVRAHRAHGTAARAAGRCMRAGDAGETALACSGHRVVSRLATRARAQPRVFGVRAGCTRQTGSAGVGTGVFAGGACGTPAGCSGGSVCADIARETGTGLGAAAVEAGETSRAPSAGAGVGVFAGGARQTLACACVGSVCADVARETGTGLGAAAVEAGETSRAPSAGAGVGVFAGGAQRAACVCRTRAVRARAAEHTGRRVAPGRVRAGAAPPARRRIHAYQPHSAGAPVGVARRDCLRFVLDYATPAPDAARARCVRLVLRATSLAPGLSRGIRILAHGALATQRVARVRGRRSVRTRRTRSA